MSIRILSVVLNNFKNDTRVIKEGVSLKKAGYSVQVIALHEEGFPEKAIEHTLDVHRIKLATRHWAKIKPVQLIKYFEFIIKVLFSYSKSADVIHCHDLNALPIGVLSKLLTFGRVKVVYDAHEFETEVHGLSRSSKLVMKILERICIKFTDENIIPSRLAAEAYAEMYSIVPPVQVLNCPYYDKMKATSVLRDEFNIKSDQKLFLYQGVLAEGRGIEILLDVFANLESNNAVMIFMGFGPLEGMIKSYSMKYNSILFREAVSPDILHSYTASCDVGISFIEDTCLSYKYCMPNKLFEYLMAGLPVLVSARPLMKEIVEKENVGIVAMSDDSAGFKKAIESMIDADFNIMRNNVAKLRETKKFSWEKQEEKLLQIYQRLTC